MVATSNVMYVYLALEIQSAQTERFLKCQTFTEFQKFTAHKVKYFINVLKYWLCVHIIIFVTYGVNKVLLTLIAHVSFLNEAATKF